MKKVIFLKLSQSDTQLDKRLINIEKFFLEKNNEPQHLNRKWLLVSKIPYYFNIALTLIASVIDFIVKLVEAYNKIP